MGYKIVTLMPKEKVNLLDKIKSYNLRPPIRESGRILKVPKSTIVDLIYCPTRM